MNKFNVGDKVYVCEKLDLIESFIVTKVTVSESAETVEVWYTISNQERELDTRRPYSDGDVELFSSFDEADVFRNESIDSFIEQAKSHYDHTVGKCEKSRENCNVVEVEEFK